MIELTVIGSDRPALVDDCRSDLVGYRWRLDKHGYVMRKAKGRRIYLHHVILPGKRYPTYLRDHENRDKMDNRSSNLRWLTALESVQNRGPAQRNPLGLRGVRRAGSRFRAVATVNGIAHRLGLFDDPHEADRVLTAFRAQHMPASSADTLALG